MKRLQRIVAISSIVLLGTAKAQEVSTTTTRVAELSHSNPFFAESKLPYHVPPFDKIKDQDYLPAYRAGMKEQLKEMNRIAANPAKATFQNTVQAMEQSGRLLFRVMNAFNLVSEANTNKVLTQTKQELAPEIAAHRDAIYTNTALFNRVKSLYDGRSTLKIDSQDRRLIELIYIRFIIAGAQLSDPQKQKLKDLNKREAVLKTAFGDKTRSAGNDSPLIVDDTTDLAGLTSAEIQLAKQNATQKGLIDKWLIPLINTTQQPSMSSLEKREIRKRLFDLSWNRNEKKDTNDSRSTVLELATIRTEKATLLGFNNIAAWKLQNQMAKTPEAVFEFIGQIVPSLNEKIKRDSVEIQSFINKIHPQDSLMAWDWKLYGDQLMKQKYDINQNEIRPYLELNSVLQNGVFYAANFLYGITFKERRDLPVYQPDVRVFEVFDKDNSPLGMFYADYFKRENKSGGAWMSNLVNQSTMLGTKPVIYNVCNFAKPAEGQPALLTLDDVRTIFHEFGHGLAGLFTKVKYATVSQMEIPRDYVEFASQFNEHWSMEPQVMKHYAFHYNTHEPMPDSLISKVRTSAFAVNAYDFAEVMAATYLDMRWHTLTTNNTVANSDSFENAVLTEGSLNHPAIPSRYRTTYFHHIWAANYFAGYYAYTWSKMLSEDAFAWFQEHGGFTRKNGQHYRDMLLSTGNIQDPATLYRKFAGHDPKIQPLLKAEGLAVEP